MKYKKILINTTIVTIVATGILTPFFLNNSFVQKNNKTFTKTTQKINEDVDFKSKYPEMVKNYKNYPSTSIELNNLNQYAEDSKGYGWGQSGGYREVHWSWNRAAKLSDYFSNIMNTKLVELNFENRRKSVVKSGTEEGELFSTKTFDINFEKNNETIILPGLGYITRDAINHPVVHNTNHDSTLSFKFDDKTTSFSLKWSSLTIFDGFKGGWGSGYTSIEEWSIGTKIIYYNPEKTYKEMVEVFFKSDTFLNDILKFDVFKNSLKTNSILLSNFFNNPQHTLQTYINSLSKKAVFDKIKMLFPEIILPTNLNPDNDLTFEIVIENNNPVLKTNFKYKDYNNNLKTLNSSSIIDFKQEYLKSTFENNSTNTFNLNTFLDKMIENNYSKKEIVEMLNSNTSSSLITSPTINHKIQNYITNNTFEHNKKLKINWTKYENDNFFDLTNLFTYSNQTTIKLEEKENYLMLNKSLNYISPFINFNMIDYNNFSSFENNKINQIWFEELLGNQEEFNWDIKIVLDKTKIDSKHELNGTLPLKVIFVYDTMITKNTEDWLLGKNTLPTKVSKDAPSIKKTIENDIILEGLKKLDFNNISTTLNVINEKETIQTSNINNFIKTQTNKEEFFNWRTKIENIPNGEKKIVFNKTPNSTEISFEDWLTFFKINNPNNWNQKLTLFTNYLTSTKDKKLRDDLFIEFFKNNLTINFSNNVPQEDRYLEQLGLKTISTTLNNPLIDIDYKSNDFFLLTKDKEYFLASNKDDYSNI
ncbi:MAG: hypothetical protein ACRC4M_05210, partial [Mycoplasma sp.]